LEHLIPVFELAQVLFGSVKEFLLALAAALSLILLWRRVKRSSSAEEDEIEQ
jgi:hypothetical protein